MSTGEAVYRAVLRGVRLAAPLLSLGDSKLARGVRGRRGAARALVRWGTEERDRARPGAWFHAPSVGEGLQARAVMRCLVRRVPGIQFAFTHFSPSARALARTMSASAAGFLPWDLPDEIGPVLDAVAPDLVAFTKTEVWPTLSGEAERRGIPLVLVAATLPESAGRLRMPGRIFLRPSFRRLGRVCAISDDHGERFRRLGVPEARIVVTGDPGIDSAASRAEAADPASSHLEPFVSEPRPTLVAGSTWPSDEAVLVPASTGARARHPELRLVVAPHEPDEGHLRPLMAALLSEGWAARRLSAVEEAGSAEGADAVVVDRVGVLSDLYSVGAVAWVGGGFHRDGLHSVLEPAAHSVPVIVGPEHAGSRAASDLLEAGAAMEVTSVDGARGAIEAWLDDDASRRDAGARGRRYVDGHRGAAERTARILEEVLEEGRA